MLFHTSAFAVFFLLFLACYLPVRRTRWGVRVIVVFSSVFYGSWDWRFLPLLWLTILVDYFIAKWMGATSTGAVGSTGSAGLAETHDYDLKRSVRRRLLILSIVCNLGILFYFKYWNFVVATALGTSSVAKQLSNPELILPLGISFYIFQSMSYVIDVYRGRQEPLRNVGDFAAFVTFFPHLVAGPIQRIQQLVPQILNPDNIDATRLISGALLFSAGFLRKSCGDILASYHDPVFNGLDKAEPSAVVISLFTFGLQIYLDFAGYSEMAVGIARCLGIDLMDNFKAPYLSTSIQEFWRRWHISLSFWLRDYLYISLGGSRAGWVMQARNLLFTMTVCGLWHGAALNFALWGLLHGLLMVLNTVYRRFIAGGSLRTSGGGLIPGIGWALTYVLTNYLWLYFRVPTWREAVVGNWKVLAWLAEPSVPLLPAGILYIAAAVLIADLYTKWRDELIPVRIVVTPRRAIAYGAVTALVFVTALILSVGQPTVQFIYFMF